MGWTGGYVLLALLLAPYLRKFGKFTVPEFIGDRYYSQTARVVAVICLIFISFTYVAGQMRRITSYNVCYTKLLRTTTRRSGVESLRDHRDWDRPRSPAARG